MEKEFVTYELALRMKALGFDEPCFAWYDGRYTSSINENYCKNSEEWLNTIHCATPLYQQAFRWFREKFGLNHEINYAGREGEYNAFVNDYVYGNNSNSPSVFTYEEAEISCLQKLIEISESKLK
jgi:hypothetical protein